MTSDRADVFREQADAWIDENPEAWRFMTIQALKSAENRRRFGIGALCEVVRWEMRNVRGDEFKLNNSYRAAFARRLVREHPEIAPYITMRKSVLDRLEA